MSNRQGPVVVVFLYAATSSLVYGTGVGRLQGLQASFSKLIPLDRVRGHSPRRRRCHSGRSLSFFTKDHAVRRKSPRGL